MHLTVEIAWLRVRAVRCTARALPMPGRPLALVVQSGSCAHRMPCIRSPSDLDSRSAATARGRGGPEARSAMTEAGGSSRGYPRGGPATNDRESSWRTIAFVIETARQRTPGLRRDQAPSPWITAKWPPTMPVGRAIAVRQNRMVGGVPASWIFPIVSPGARRLRRSFARGAVAVALRAGALIALIAIGI